MKKSGSGGEKEINFNTKIWMKEFVCEPFGLSCHIKSQRDRSFIFCISQFLCFPHILINKVMSLPFLADCLFKKKIAVNTKVMLDNL